VEVNRQQQHGYSALHIAMKEGNTATVQLLVNAGADPHLASNR